MDNIFLEVNFSDLTPQKITTTRLRVDKPTVFITIPDTNVKIYQSIPESGLMISNCRGIISPNKTVKIGGKRFMGRLQNLELKKNAVKGSTGRKLKVLSNMPKIEVNGKNRDFYIYDMTIYVEALKYGLDKYSEKIAGQKFFNDLTTIYNVLKTSNVNVSFPVLLLVKNNNGSLSTILKNIRTIIPTKSLEELMFFDRFVLASNVDNTIIPIIDRFKLKNRVHFTNIKKLFSKLDITDEAEPKTVNNAIEHTPKKKEIPLQNSMLNKIMKNLQQSSLVAGDGKEPVTDVKISVNIKQLTDVLQKYKIKDPDIVANVKSALRSYIAMKGGKPSKDEAETVVLKAINFTVHGTEEIDEHYLAKPEKLIKKLANVRTHKTPLNFPKSDKIISPTDIIDIKHTTGVWRQKHEFEKTVHENVKKLFSSLESVSSRPIKIKKFEHEVIDDDISRMIHYKVTLQNTTGGAKEPYIVELKVPASVNDRYFKIDGKTYIMATQQFFKPVTKTETDKVRVISNYSIVHIGIKNMKFNPADIDDIIAYIKVRYQGLIKNDKETEITFSDGSKVFLIGQNVYSYKKSHIQLSEETGKLIDQDGTEIQKKKFEFIYDKLLDKIQTVNPDDKLTKTKRTIPYLYFYVGGITLPLIVYLWQLKGLLTTLNDLGINYELAKTPKPGEVIVETADKGYLVINPTGVRQRLIVNGILQSRFKTKIKNLDDPEEIHPYIDNTYGSKATLNMRILTQNMIDPLTKELLEFENLPTNLPNLISTHCIDVLLNKKTDSMSDLRIYRARLSEMMLNIMYKQISIKSVASYSNVCRIISLIQGNSYQLAA